MYIVYKKSHFFEVINHLVDEKITRIKTSKSLSFYFETCLIGEE